MRTLLHDITAQLQTHYAPAEARELAFWMLEELTGLSRAQILTTNCSQLEEDTQLLPWVRGADRRPEGYEHMSLSSAINQVVARLLKDEPIQHIFGHTLWLGLDLQVTPDTLIPRPETADLIPLVETALTVSSPLLLDIGTGSGCIAIALKHRHPDWQVHACDISDAALAVARTNAEQNQTDIHFFRCDILHAIPAHAYDAIVSNPPYVCEEEKTSMESNVLCYEPASALFVPDNDPLLFYRRIASLAADAEIGLLKRGGHLFFEVNERFADDVAALLQDQGFEDARVSMDQFGKPRFVSAQLPAPKTNTALLSRAQHYCSAAEHCRQEVREKLRQWGAENTDVIEEILTLLEENNYINESRYAAAFCNDKVRFAGWGKHKIRLALLAKQISDDTIREALATIDETEYQALLDRLTEKKLRQLAAETDPQKKRAKLRAFLASRGF